MYQDTLVQFLNNKTLPTTEVGNFDVLKMDQIIQTTASGMLSLSAETTLHNNLVGAVTELWINHADTFSVIDRYRILEKYETRFGKTSEALFDEWKRGVLNFSDSTYNEWLMSYLPIRNFLVHGAQNNL
jgi:hypothetical protein